MISKLNMHLLQLFYRGKIL